MNGSIETPSLLDLPKTFPDDIQEEASGYFKQIYTEPPQPSMSVEEFLEILKQLRDSGEKKQRVKRRFYFFNHSNQKFFCLRTFLLA